MVVVLLVVPVVVVLVLLVLFNSTSGINLGLIYFDRRHDAFLLLALCSLVAAPCL